MNDNLLSRIKTVNPDLLADVVRKDQRSPQFEITGWSVDPLSDQGITNPEGLWLYRGQGYDQEGTRSWSVVLKTLNRQEQEPELWNMWHWKRELLVAQSGLLNDLPGPVRAPQYYRADETPEGAWLWLEYIENHRAEPWGLDEYAFAARQLGRWNGAVQTAGRVYDQPWLAHGQYRLWYSGTNPEQDLQFALNQKYITGELRQRYERLWADRQLFYDTVELLPAILTHCDSQRRNLMIRKAKDGQDELVLIDWAQCGLLPVGAELLMLVGMSTMLFEWPAAAVAELDTAVFRSYLQGLREAGWSGSPDSARLAYLAWTTVWLGITFPNIVALWCTPERRADCLRWFGVAEEEAYQAWLPMFHYALDCADEARQILSNSE